MLCEGLVIFFMLHLTQKFLLPSATSRSYSKVLRCLYSTAYGVLQCSARVVWRVSRVSEVAGESAAESC